MSRKLVYYVACTADGFIARPDGSFDCFLFQGEHFPMLFERFPETFPTHLRTALGIPEGARRFDTVLMGRSTYEVGLAEGVTNPYRPLRQIVFSRRMSASPDPSVELHAGSPVDLVRSLKRQEGRDIWLCGGGKLAATLLPEIDEFILKINPVFIGQGIPLLDGFTGTLPAAMIECTPFPNGFILVRHAAVRS